MGQKCEKGITASNMYRTKMQRERAVYAEVFKGYENRQLWPGEECKGFDSGQCGEECGA